MTEDKTKASGSISSEFMTRPKGRYEKYESRVQKAYTALSFVRRHRVAICLITALLVAAVFTFLFCIGIFVGDVSCNDFTYGDTPAFSAKAFMSDVSYQYATNTASPVWSDTMPAQPGEYLIRAVTQNPLGINRYSEEKAFVLKTRKLTIDVEDASCIYGNLTDNYLLDKTKITGLAKGDSVKNIEFNCSDENRDTVYVSVSSFRVINSDGADVSAAYETTCESAVITVLTREITVSTNGGEKTYDGMPWTGASASVTKGSLAQGDRIDITFPSFPTDVGSYTVAESSYKIINKDGSDVTHKYSITLERGVLTVLARPLVFTTASATKVYDEKPLSNPQWSLLEGSLADGHTLSAKTIGSRHTAGESLNNLEILISDPNGNDVKSNYNITVQAGKLIITPIVLKFRTDSAEKIYDGKNIRASGYELIEGEILPSHRLFCETSGTQTDVGERNNNLIVEITNSSYENVTYDGYKIEVEYGKLKVTPRPITVTSESAEKIYDGTPLICHTMSMTEGTLAATDTEIVPSFVGMQTEVGQSSNTFYVTIINSSRTNKTSNYSITYIYGTLTVLPDENGGSQGENPGGSQGSNPGGSQGSNPENNNDYIPGSGVTIGFPDTSGDNTTFAQIRVTSGFSSAFQSYLRITSYGAYNGSGFEAANEYTRTVNGIYISALDFVGRAAELSGIPFSFMEIERLKGCPVLIPYYSYSTQKYFGQSDIYFTSDLTKYEYAFFQIPELSAIMDLAGSIDLGEQQQAYEEYVYSEYLQIPQSTRKELLRIAEENGIVKSSDTYALITDIQNYIKSAASYNLSAKPYPEGVDVAVYFLDVAKEGICQHYATSATMMYRAFGIPARFVGGFKKEITNDNSYDITSLDAHAWVEIYLDGIGWVPIEVTGSLNIPPDDTRTQLVITSYSASKEYDGKPFGAWESDKFAFLKGQLLPGHTISVTMVEMGLNGSLPGSYMNDITKVVIYDENGNDVTNELYNLTILEGHMTIKKRKLTVQLGSASKVYDGTPLSCDDWWIVNGNLPPDNYLSVSISLSLIGAGRVENIADLVSVYTYNSRGQKITVTDCYEITVLPGVLEIITE